jgi:hypothetical protein
MLKLRDGGHVDVKYELRNLLGYVESEHKDEVIKGGQMIAGVVQQHYLEIIKQLDQEKYNLAFDKGVLETDMSTLTGIIKKYTPYDGE